MYRFIWAFIYIFHLFFYQLDTIDVYKANEFLNFILRIFLRRLSLVSFAWVQRGGLVCWRFQSLYLQTMVRRFVQLNILSWLSHSFFRWPSPSLQKEIKKKFMRYIPTEYNLANLSAIVFRVYFIKIAQKYRLKARHSHRFSSTLKNFQNIETLLWISKDMNKLKTPKVPR